MSHISKALINKVAREWRQAAPQLSATDRPAAARKWKNALQGSRPLYGGKTQYRAHVRPSVEKNIAG